MGKLYVAYGSNLNLLQMKFRCPTAKLVATGEIENYELQFKGRPDCSYATIAPKENTKVPVAIWDIQALDEKKLDRYEGYPNSYFKQNIDVNVGNKTISAMVYIMDLKQNFGIPSEIYYNTVAQGYLDCGLDIDLLNQAVNDSIDNYLENYPEFENDYFDFLGEDDQGVGDLSL